MRRGAEVHGACGSGAPGARSAPGRPRLHGARGARGHGGPPRGAEETQPRTPTAQRRRFVPRQRLEMYDE